MKEIFFSLYINWNQNQTKRIIWQSEMMNNQSSKWTLIHFQLESVNLNLHRSHVPANPRQE